MGDFNAHHSWWVCCYDDSFGRVLSHVIDTHRLIILNDCSCRLPSADILVRLYSILKFSMRFPLNLDFSVRSQVFRCLLLTYCLRCFLVGERRIWPLLVEAADLEPALKHLGFLYLTVVSGNGRPCGVTHQQYSVSAWHWTGAYDPSRRQAGRAPCRAVSLAERHAGVSGYKNHAKSFVRLDFGFVFLAYT